MFKYNKIKNGFTILEILITMLVITIGGSATYAIVQQIVFDTFTSSYRLTAAHLAKERVEFIRNMRDTNWLQGEAWNYNIDSDTLDSNIPSNYNRNTTISYNPDGSMNVSVEVSWDIRGNDGTITVQENLYNWLPI